MNFGCVKEKSSFMAKKLEMRKSWTFKNPILVTQSITNIGFELLYYSAKTEHMYEVNTQKSTQGALISNTLERVDITTL